MKVISVTGWFPPRKRLILSFVKKEHTSWSYPSLPTSWVSSRERGLASGVIPPYLL